MSHRRLNCCGSEDARGIETSSRGTPIIVEWNFCTCNFRKHLYALGLHFQFSPDSVRVIWGYSGPVFGPVSGGTVILVKSIEADLDGVQPELVLQEPGGYEEMRGDRPFSNK